MSTEFQTSSAGLQRLEMERQYNDYKPIHIHIIQNMIGALCAVLLMLSVYALYKNKYNLESWQLYMYIALIIFSFTCSVRFLKDEFSLLFLAFKLGATSQNATIQRLQEENNKLNKQLTMQHSSIATRRIDKSNLIVQTAQKLIKLFYTGHSIDRTTCSKNGIREVDWDEARELLVKAGIIDTTKPKRTVLLPKTSKQALNKLKETIDV